MYQRKTAFFLNPNRPVTCKGLTAAIQAAKPSTLCAVPYTLKLLREQQSGIEALKSCGQVVFTGSQCPDDLGDFLVGQGVNLATFMGAYVFGGRNGLSTGADISAARNAASLARPSNDLQKIKRGIIFESLRL